jgi:hypothetical protein
MQLALGTLSGPRGGRKVGEVSRLSHVERAKIHVVGRCNLTQESLLRRQPRFQNCTMLTIAVDRICCTNLVFLTGIRVRSIGILVPVDVNTHQ